MKPTYKKGNGHTIPKPAFGKVNGNGNGNGVGTKHTGKRKSNRVLFGYGRDPIKQGNPGGRPKGAKDKIKHAMLKRIAQQAVDGKKILPLDFMLDTLNDRNASWKRRAWAADRAAVYLHRKMPIAIEGGDKDRPLVFATASMLEGLPQTELDVLLKVMARVGREQFMRDTGVKELVHKAVIDHDTGEEEVGSTHG